MPANRSWADLPIDDDMTPINLEGIDANDCAAYQSFDEILGILAAPISGKPVVRDTRARPDKHEMMFHHGRPLLFPDFVNQRIVGDEVRIGLEDVSDAALQYIYLNIVKNSGGEHNACLSDLWYRRHLHRSRMLVRSAKGLVLDVGCDNPALSRRLFPTGVRYLGIDPGLGTRSEPCLIGMAEFLPIRSETLDGVAFLTSLDHILDYHAALDEAYRVLKPGGQLFLGTLIWTHRAELIRDNIHFHHFRQHEIEGALAAFRIDRLTRYTWKDDKHRFGVYLMATKPEA